MHRFELPKLKRCNCSTKIKHHECLEVCPRYNWVSNSARIKRKGAIQAEYEWHQTFNASTLRPQRKMADTNVASTLGVAFVWKGPSVPFEIDEVSGMAPFPVVVRWALC